MALHSSEIEQVVRQVLDRLTALGQGEVSSLVATTTASENAAAATAGEVRLMDQVISVASLEGRCESATVVRVRAKSVVTPAAREWLKQRKITLNRVDTNNANNAAGSSTPALLVLGDSRWLNSIAKSVCPKRASVITDSLSIADAIQRIHRQLETPRKAAILVSEKSFEASIALNRNTASRAVRIGQWQELAPAIEQASPNVLILDASKFNAASSLNAINRFYDSGVWRKGASN